MEMSNGRAPTPMNRQIARGTVLLIDDDESIRKLVSIALQRAGYEVTLAEDGQEGLVRLAESVPDLVVSDVNMPGLDGFSLLKHLRSDPSTSSLPVIMLTAKSSVEEIVEGLQLGADDYLAKPFAMTELVARVQAKIERPSIPSSLLPNDRSTGLLSEHAFTHALDRELTFGGPQGVCLGYLALDELPRVRERFGLRAVNQIARQVALLLDETGPFRAAGRDTEDRFTVLLPSMEPDEARRRLVALSQRIASREFEAAGQRLRLTPVIGFVPPSPGASVEELQERAQAALHFARLHLDLEPVQYDATMDPAWREARGRAERQRRWWIRLSDLTRFPLQLLLVNLLAIVIPLGVYVGLDAIGIRIVPAMYLIVVVALLLTAFLIWWEGFLALDVANPPERPGMPYPAASAIIAAYLPNEAATIVETVEAFRRLDYPGSLQIIVAYNTPRDLPVEATLRDIARRDSRVLPLRVETSTSKAQNVNAALAEVTGEFVGVFDADHHPDPGSFRRAWRWLSNGYDVVQGHCLVRNGDESWVARMIAVEFEAIYAVSHPGRARLHQFGIFGGSNGYWRTALLSRIRMHGFMLTEDIDSSLRTVEAGYRIASDPHLVSRGTSWRPSH
jgi:DNA-binding response OmpR family regulator